MVQAVGAQITGRAVTATVTFDAVITGQRFFAYQVQLAPVIGQCPGFGFIDPHQRGFKADIFRHSQAYGMVQGFDELIAAVRISREIRFTNAGNDRLRLHLIRVNRRQR